jgi:hypothetical protein
MAGEVAALPLLGGGGSVTDAEAKASRVWKCPLVMLAVRMCRTSRRFGGDQCGPAYKGLGCVEKEQIGTKTFCYYFVTPVFYRVS